MREYDELARYPFLAKYGFKMSTKFVGFDDGHEFDSQALLAAAHGFQHPDQGRRAGVTWRNGSTQPPHAAWKSYGLMSTWAAQLRSVVCRYR